jgi:hypothetical protein
LSHHRAPAYKLPPDVELSMTTSPDDDLKSSKAVDDADVTPSRDDLKRRRESSSERLKPDEDFKPQNGLVTLSRSGWMLSFFLLGRVNQFRPKLTD